MDAVYCIGVTFVWHSSAFALGTHTGVLVETRRVCGMLQANQCENTLRSRTAIIISADMPRVSSAERIHKTEIDLFVFFFSFALVSLASTGDSNQRGNVTECRYENFDCYRRQ